MMIICIKQHLSNIWCSIHEKGKQHGDWVEKKRCFKKKRVIQPKYGLTHHIEYKGRQEFPCSIYYRLSTEYECILSR